MVKATHSYWATGIERRRLYAIWGSMRRRCSDPSCLAYPRYGGSGIAVCAQWKSFAVFLEDMGPRPMPGYSIDRIDGALGYEPSNCRWATPREQARNTRRNRLVNWNGTTRCLSEWAEVVGIAAYNLKYRLNKGWSVDEAFSTPLPIEPTETCKNGHTRTPQNTTRVKSNGRLVCRECNRAAVDRYKQRKTSHLGESA